LSAASLHTCFLRGSVPWCFGWNGSGQLGIDSDVGQRNFPVAAVAPR
jgi:hypothetical protein